MKKLVEVVEVSDEGFVSLMSERITVFCGNYIYTGVLEGVNEEYVKLKEASIVYETGALGTKDWHDAQKLPNPVYVMKHAIECFLILK